MKKIAIVFSITLLIGLFFTNASVAQNVWTPENNTTTLGNVGIGTLSPIAPFHLERTAPGLSAVQRMIRDGAAAAGIAFDKAGTGETAAGPNDFMGAFLGRLHDGNTYQASAAVRFQAAGDISAGVAPGQIIFQTRDVTGPIRTAMLLSREGNLYLDGKITASEVEVKLDVWPDFVFADDYELMSLYEVENYIKQNRHLPNLPSEAQVLENGVNVGEMTSVLLQKVEELTLHIIELNKRIEELEK